MVNLKIARELSRKRFLQRVKTRYYQKKLQILELHLTFTINNIFVNFSNGVGNSFWVKTFGIIGYNGARRKTRYALYYYGLEVGEFLLNFLKEWQLTSSIYKDKTILAIPIRLVLHSAVSESGDLRYKRFMEGVRKFSLYFSEFCLAAKIPYNGCRVAKKRRTRRFRFFK